MNEKLPKKIKRARMKMDDPNYYAPKRIRGNIVHKVSSEGEIDSTGEEEMGPNYMQEENNDKEARKGIIVAVMKRKMKKKQGKNNHRDESEYEEESRGKRKYS